MDVINSYGFQGEMGPSPYQVHHHALVELMNDDVPESGELMEIQDCLAVDD